MITERLVADESYPGMNEALIEALNRYVHDGILPGSFLQAYLRNDLAEALARADYLNRYRLGDIVGYIYHHVPPAMWGSLDKVTTHIDTIRKANNAS